MILGINGSVDSSYTNERKRLFKQPKSKGLLPYERYLAGKLPQGLVQVHGSADEGQVSKGLGEVP